MWLHKAWLQPGVGRTEGEGGGAGLGRGLGAPITEAGSSLPPDRGTQSSASHLPPSVAASSLPVLTSLPQPHLKRMLIEWEMTAFPKEMK